MGNNDNRIFKFDQKFFQPCDRIQIQMVGRLIQKQDIRVTEQRFGKQYLDLIVTAEIAHHRVVQLGTDTETV